MKMNVKNRCLLVALAALMAFTFTGCSFRDVAKAVVVKLVGTNSNDDEEEIPDIEASAGGSVNLPEGMDTSGRIATLVQDGNLYIAFNGIQNRTTDYFSPSSSSVEISSQATTEAATYKSYKIALWELSDDNQHTTYVEGSTVFYTADGSCYKYNYTGLDSNKQYKIVISYDSGSYYVTGTAQVSGVDGDLTVVEGAEGNA